MYILLSSWRIIRKAFCFVTPKLVVSVIKRNSDYASIQLVTVAGDSLEEIESYFVALLYREKCVSFYVFNCTGNKDLLKEIDTTHMYN